jgi:formyl-CoA transferase
MWAALSTAIGIPDLMEDPRFKTGKQRHENREALFEVIANWTRQRTKQEAMHIFADSGICASQVYETNDLFTDPHLLERGFIHEVTHADHGDIKLLGWPAKMSKSEVAIEAAPLLGEHTDEVMAQDLGLDSQAIAALREEGAIGREMVERDSLSS